MFIKVKIYYKYYAKNTSVKVLFINYLTKQYLCYDVPQHTILHELFFNKIFIHCANH